ncbi:MAG: ergothioneine biosynthesis protein EgtB [Allosphingosinicella sp.]|uniref:ergothioneine biosynthesis protein EgtB n=1 Tax=Allosphingosinicella sp. TaxID=2823234 RepID=UPI00393E8930
MATPAVTQCQAGLADRYAEVRRLSRAIAAPLSDADATIQPHDDASPAKWHLAHTTWFFETFLLRDHVPGYRLHDERWSYLFNSYYEGEGDRHARPRRGMLSRPSLDEVLAYRDAVDSAIHDVMDVLPPDLVELGLQHEQQHQELLLMDMLAALAENPLKPALYDPAPHRAPPDYDAYCMIMVKGGLVEIGHGGPGFAFDCEQPRHQQFLRPYQIADRVILNREWQDFMADGGYSDPRLWLSDGWAWVQANGIEAPLYWERGDGGWLRFGLDGMREVDPHEPVCHVSHYEVDAYARWAGARLPTEAEWEHAASIMDDPGKGDLFDSPGPVRPRSPLHPPHVEKFFGGVWQWTASAYLPYPGFRPAEGTVGEYNGKFMSGQMVLRGGSFGTPRGHVRASYRNFFYPHQRWMFSGLRLAKDA